MIKFVPNQSNTLFWAAKIGSKIREQRKKIGLSLEEFSLLSGSTVSTLSNIERGKRDVKLSTLVSLASALRINLSELFQTESNELEKRDPCPRVKGYDLDDN